MKNSYKVALALFAGAFYLPYANAQTQYGEGAGTVGAGRVFIGTYAGKSNGVNGLYNTYIGYGSGTKGITDYGNVYVGVLVEKRLRIALRIPLLETVQARIISMEKVTFTWAIKQGCLQQAILTSVLDVGQVRKQKVPKIAFWEMKVD